MDETERIETEKPMIGTGVKGRDKIIIGLRFRSKEEKPVMFPGPGRWGMTMSSCGMPVASAEINPVAVPGKIAKAIVSSKEVFFFSVR